MLEEINPVEGRGPAMWGAQGDPRQILLNYGIRTGLVQSDVPYTCQSC